MRKILFTVAFVAALFPVPVKCQVTSTKISDTNTLLHALAPDYPVPYGPPSEKDVTSILHRLLKYLDASTPARLIDAKTKKEVKNMEDISENTIIEPGVFRIISYEWGVAYGAMLLAADATGEDAFSEYSVKRMELIGHLAQYFRKENSDPASPVRSVLHPGALDDAGSMCAAMIKTYMISRDENLLPCIANYRDYITSGQYRLSDGTLARNRPLPDALWLDDLYMSVPALAYLGKMTGNKSYFDDACRQVIQFSGRMFNEDIGLYMHGWIKSMSHHPEFHWARCNGWALLAMSELLDALPAEHPARDKILNQFCALVNGIVSCQSGTGLWHQLLDRSDSYTETSASAIFTYCIAHGINKGWLEPQVYGPSAVLGWNAVSSRVNELGQVEGTCVGTGMAFDPAFYYHRPVSVAAAHGYGPVIMAGAEMLNLLRDNQVVINDSAVIFYKQGTDWSKNR